MNNRRHYAAAIAAFVIWGFFSIPLRALRDYSAGEILYFRIIFSILVLTIIIGGFKRKDLKTEWLKFRELTASQRKSVTTLTLFGGLLLSINWLIFIYVVNNINIRTASFSYLICPVITAILGTVLIKERMTAIQWTSVGLCAVSCLLIGISSSTELGYSFFTAFTYALYLISQRKNQGFDRMILLGVQTLFAFMILSFFAGYLVNDIPDSPRFYSIITVIAIAFTVLPLFLNLYALNRINSATIGILMYLNPIVNFTIAFIVFNETVDNFQIAGYMLIAIALVIFNYQYFLRLKTFP
jgi:chloramphenicol-sensitive protein RarD